MGQQLKSVQAKISQLKKFATLIEDCNAYIEILESQTDQDLFDELCQSLQNIEQNLETLRLQTLLNGKYDKNNGEHEIFHRPVSSAHHNEDNRQRKPIFIP